MLKNEFFEIYTQAEILHLSKSAVNINNDKNIESYYGAVHKRFSLNIKQKHLVEKPICHCLINVLKKFRPQMNLLTQYFNKKHMFEADRVQFSTILHLISCFLGEMRFPFVLKSVCFSAGTSPSGVQGPHLNGGQAPSHAEEERGDERVRHTLPHHLDGREEHQEAPGHRHHQPGRSKVTSRAFNYCCTWSMDAKIVKEDHQASQTS